MSSQAAARRARLGVSLYFFTNGVMLAGILPRYPEVKAAFELTNTQFGFLVASMPLGAIAASLLPGPLIRRYGARAVVLGGTVVAAGAMALVGFAPAVWLLAAGLFLFGFLDAIVDAAQNVHGVKVEQANRKSIMNSLHALWSIGAALGGLVGVGAMRAGIGLGPHLVAISLLGVAVTAWATRRAALPEAASLDPATEKLLVDDPPVEDVRALGEREERTAPRPAAEGTGHKPWVALLLLGVLALSGTLLEDVAMNWSALYLHTVAGMAMTVAGFGYVLMISAQFVGRMLGDPMTDRWGRSRVAALGGLLVILGSGLAMGLATPAPVLVGFILIGFGCATLVPAAYAAAGNLPGFAEGTGITVVGWLMRVGFLFTSPIIGIISDGVGMRWSMVVPMTAGLAAIALATWIGARMRTT